MTFSNRLRTKWAASALAVASALMTGCSVGGTPEAGQSSGAHSSSPFPPAPSTDNAVEVEQGKDGRTLQPGSAARSCEAFSPAELGVALGERAANLQEGQGEVSIDREGTTVDTCVYPLEKLGGVDHSLIVERKDFPSAEQLRASDPFGMLMTQEPVDGLKGDARFGVNTLSGSTEYVVVSVSELRISRLLLSEPSSGQTIEAHEAKKVLAELAIQAGF